MAGLADNVARVLRGGSYNNEGVNLRCAARNRNNPNNRNKNIGFRCVARASFMLLLKADRLAPERSGRKCVSFTDDRRDRNGEIAQPRPG
ncbi:MAG: hypothetical protein DYG85_16520 [Chloroflexi bacterium CFX1]|nr:hypothetical protein [Chloroflexi bacterium CFX1]MCQ3953981.1 hypothetical protein [Chloroflexota bacterium]MDL1920671.1 hypothetical protein [Chloroflexi bacterium CFX5]NUQ58450.1 SUMF1/EgtB/PvdO family nonheme iron enzyme [Anaerolineales bacterium]